METKKGISGFGMKMIAVIAMLIDHTAATVLERMLLRQALPRGVPGGYESWWSVYFALRAVGRIAFPIYCFFIVEGFHCSRDRRKYALRLLLFALISEIPFDLALRGRPFFWGYSNVFFTLFLGLVTIMAIDWSFGKLSSQKASVLGAQKVGIAAALLLADFLLAELLLHTDYGVTGVLAIVVIYLLYQKRLLGFALAVTLLALLLGAIELWALFGLIPLYFYNGTRGRQAKYFFYAFYPAHLFILALICYGVGLG